MYYFKPVKRLTAWAHSTSLIKVFPPWLYTKDSYKEQTALPLSVQPNLGQETPYPKWNTWDEVTSMSDARIFALDIGTHKIAGLLMSRSPQGYVIEHAVMFDQLPQAMRDGQIHQIASVAQVVRAVKAYLEEASGIALEEAAVAAAGRSLITRKAKAARTLHPAEPLSSDDVKSLELQAVAHAMEELTAISGQGALDSYLCVGYSVVQYWLDGAPIGSLVGHRGLNAEVEVIATFLPRVVIDSLTMALEMAELRMASITLEPIAAMHVIVPPTMRMLNIALVDIGAGTSDIALAADSTIKAYGMVAAAGDEITEQIAHRFLLDLTTAEKVKQRANPETNVQCQDVFGNALSLSYEDILEAMLPNVEKLADEIADQITSLNAGPPSGVLLVGGGSQTPKLAELIQERLQLPANLVRLRDRTSIANVTGCPEFTGPQVITPVGIGCAHLDGITMQFINAAINERRIQFLKMPGSSVGDALIQAGYTQADLMGADAGYINVKIGGRSLELPRIQGTTARVIVNGQEADLSTPISDNAIVEVRPADPQNLIPIRLADLLDSDAACFGVKLNGEPITIEPLVLVNGKRQSMDYELTDGDEVEVVPIQTIGELLETRGIELYYQVSYFLNGEARTVSRPLAITVAGQAVSHHTGLIPDMEIWYEVPRITLKDILPDNLAQPITVTVNGQSVTLEPEDIKAHVNGELQSLDYTIRDGDQIAYDEKSFSFIVTDIFRVYEPDPQFTAAGGQITVNDKMVGFTAPLKDGDVIELIPQPDNHAVRRLPLHRPD